MKRLNLDNTICPIYIATSENESNIEDNNQHIIDYLEKELPNDDYAYVIASNGCFLWKRNDIYSSIAKVSEDIVEKDIRLLNIDMKAKILSEKIPQDLFYMIIDWFREVYSKYSSEAVGGLYYSKDNGWNFEPPFQEVSKAIASYEQMEPFDEEGRSLVGTIHSHGEMNAYFSSTDDKDDFSFDGIHIVIGTLEGPISYTARITANKKKFDIDISDIVEFEEKKRVFRKEWIDKVKKKKYTYGLSSYNKRELEGYVYGFK